MPLSDIIADIKQRIISHYQQRLPVLPGAVEVARLASERYRVALASSSPLDIVQRVLQLAEISHFSK